MEILVVDTETTGLDPESDKPIEIAAILWSISYKSILMQVSTLISYNQKVVNPVEPINKISPELLGRSFVIVPGVYEKYRIAGSELG